MMIIHCPFLSYSGMALWPFIFIKNREDKNNALLVHHERIHLRQQAEMLVLPFYLVYAIHYTINLLRYRNHDRAYREIIFEREAYAMEADREYLTKRSMWNWRKF
jgi:hypothetical protein